PSAANAQWYADIVQKKAVRRRMVEAGLRITQLGYADGELDDDLNRAGADIDAIEAMSRRDGSLIGLPTGFMDLDGLLGGFQSDQFVIVAGRPAMGKTTLAMDFARACAFDN